MKSEKNKTKYGPENPHPSVFQFFTRFPDEDSAREYLINARWPDGVICVHCGHDEVWKIRQGKLFTCKCCRKQFTVRLRTVMEDSPIALRKWLFAMYLFEVYPKGISATSLQKHLGVMYKTAWHMLHRLRRGHEYNGIVLDGEIEADETYLGGKEKNKHEADKLKAGRGTVGKQAVLGIRERGGQVVTMPVEKTDEESLAGNVRAVTAEGSLVYTDENTAYTSLAKTHRHDTVSHSSGEYARGDVHVNGIESIWSLVKRAYVGVYHHWAPKNSHRYVQEIAARQALRKIPAFDFSDGRGLSRVRLLMAGISGKRLTYAELTS